MKTRMATAIYQMDILVKKSQDFRKYVFKVEEVSWKPGFSELVKYSSLVGRILPCYSFSEIWGGIEATQGWVFSRMHGDMIFWWCSSAAACHLCCLPKGRYCSGGTCSVIQGNTLKNASGQCWTVHSARSCLLAKIYCVWFSPGLTPFGHLVGTNFDWTCMQIPLDTFWKISKALLWTLDLWEMTV
jgi:hypothetical protein